MEEVILLHDDVVEAAVVAATDAIKGDIPVGLVVLKKGRDVRPTFEKEVAALIREHIGPVAFYRETLVV